MVAFPHYPRPRDEQDEQTDDESDEPTTTRTAPFLGCAATRVYDGAKADPSPAWETHGGLGLGWEGAGTGPAPGRGRHEPRPALD